jgi:hypothetical protein
MQRGKQLVEGVCGLRWRTKGARGTGQQGGKGGRKRGEDGGQDKGCQLFGVSVLILKGF